MKLYSVTFEGQKKYGTPTRRLHVEARTEKDARRAARIRYRLYFHDEPGKISRVACVINYVGDFDDHLTM